MQSGQQLPDKQTGRDPRPSSLYYQTGRDPRPSSLYYQTGRDPRPSSLYSIIRQADPTQNSQSVCFFYRTCRPPASLITTLPTAPLIYCAWKERQETWDRRYVTADMWQKTRDRRRETWDMWQETRDRRRKTGDSEKKLILRTFKLENSFFFFFFHKCIFRTQMKQCALF